MVNNKFYMIRDQKTGEFSRGGASYVYFSKKGKMWTKSALESHLTSLYRNLSYGHRDEKDDMNAGIIDEDRKLIIHKFWLSDRNPYKACDIVEVNFEYKVLSDVFTHLNKRNETPKRIKKNKQIKE